MTLLNEDIILRILFHFIVWFLYLLAQSLLMNGIKLSSEGRSELQPDGSTKLAEMIFAPIAAYLNGSTLEKVYYEQVYLHNLLKRINYQFPQITIDDNLHWRSLTINDFQSNIWHKLQVQIEANFDLKIEFVGDCVMLYKEYPKYNISKYIRKPLLTCIICMPSFWTLWTYLLPSLIVFGFQWWTLPIYFANALSVAYLNYKIYKPL